MYKGNVFVAFVCAAAFNAVGEISRLLFHRFFKACLKRRYLAAWDGITCKCASRTCVLDVLAACEPPALHLPQRRPCEKQGTSEALAKGQAMGNVV